LFVFLIEWDIVLVFGFLFFYYELNSFYDFPFAVESVFFKVCVPIFSAIKLNSCTVLLIINSYELYWNPMKVHFEEVPDLVASRRVFLSKGYAYIAMSQVRFERENDTFLFIV
jgi:hypothetical protein